MRVRENFPAPTAEEWLTTRRFAALLAVLMFAAWPQVFLGLQTFLYRDFGYYAYPIAFYLKQSFLRGEIPLWNPLSYCGSPFLAQWNTQVLYPPVLFYVVFPLAWALPVFCILHLYLGGLGMFVLARRWTNHPLASAVAALAFAFSGLAVNSLMWPGTVPGLGWMPWVVLLVERAWREGRRAVVLAVLAGAMQMLSGAVEPILVTWLVLGALWLLDFAAGRCGRDRMFTRAAAVGLLIAGLCAAQLLPFFELLQHSNRQENFESALWPMPATGWANFLVPLFHCAPSFHGVYAQPNQSWTYSYYVGVFTVALAGWAVWRARDARVAVLAALTLLMLVLALGRATPLYDWGARHIPVVRLMRFPVKFVILPVFTLPLLAAIGLAKKTDAFQRRNDWRIVWFAVVVLMLVIFWFAVRLPSEYATDWRATLENGGVRGLFFTALMWLWLRAERTAEFRPRCLLQVLLLVLMWMDVAYHAPQPKTVNPMVYDVELKRPPLPRLGESRAMISHKGLADISHSYISKIEDDYISRRYTLFSNCHLLEDIPKMDGFFPQQIREQRMIHLLFYDEHAPDPSPEPLLDFLGASQITSATNIFDWTLRTNFMPMISAGQKPLFAADNKIFWAIANSNFNPRAEVYLPTSAKPTLLATNTAAIKISAAQFAAHRITAHVDATAPGLVVIAQSFYAPWRAYLDGRPAELLRANYAFQAVPVPAGPHELKLAYEDKKFQLGAAISLASLLVCAMAWLGFAKGKPSAA